MLNTNQLLIQRYICSYRPARAKLLCFSGTVTRKSIRRNTLLPMVGLKLRSARVRTCPEQRNAFYCTRLFDNRPHWLERIKKRGYLLFITLSLVFPPPSKPSPLSSQSKSLPSLFSQGNQFSKYPYTTSIAH